MRKLLLCKLIEKFYWSRYDGERCCVTGPRCLLHKGKGSILWRKVAKACMENKTYRIPKTKI